MQSLGWVAQDCPWLSCTPWGGGNHSFLRNPSPFAAGGEVAESSFFSLLCSTLAFSSLPTGVSFVAIWSWTWWVLFSKIVAPWKEAKNKLIIEHNVFFLVCDHCWFYLKKSLPNVATSSLIEAIVGLDQCNFNHAPWSDSAHTGLPLISLWSSSPFPVRC